MTGRVPLHRYLSQCGEYIRESPWATGESHLLLGKDVDRYAAASEKCHFLRVSCRERGEAGFNGWFIEAIGVPLRGDGEWLLDIAFPARLLEIEGSPENDLEDKDGGKEKPRRIEQPPSEMAWQSCSLSDSS
jgi:hypothetical protein